MKPSCRLSHAVVVATLLLALSGCQSSTTSSKQLTQTIRHADETICHWGERRFDLCRFDNDQARISALVVEMTVEEKIGQMTQVVWHNGVDQETVRADKLGSIIHTDGPTPGPLASDWTKKFDSFQREALNTRLGIPLLIAVDAVHGQNTFEGATIFPHNIGMAATQNLDLIEKAASVTALESAGTGFNWTFSPCIAMPQHEHWGRVYEGFSEDKDFTIAAVHSSVSGHQLNDLSSSKSIAATAKHYIADGGTQGGVEGGDSLVDEAMLRNYLLPPYKAAVDAGVASIMVGFNSVNGISMHQHSELVQGVLKDELGFEGVVVSDWNGGLRFGPAHTVVNAGVDIAMQPGNHAEFMQQLSEAHAEGIVTEERLDDAVSRILRMKFALGLFKDPYTKTEHSPSIGSPEHRQIARQAVRESLVLLKNQNQALPLKSGESIAVLGEHANNSGLQSGGWTIRWQGLKESYSGATTILDAIKKHGTTIEYSKVGCTPEMKAEKAIVVIGEYPYAEGEGDTDELQITPEQHELIDSCKRAGKKIITILISGRPLVIGPQFDTSDAFIAAWLPGSEGDGVADFLYAVDGFTPKGRSPYAWPHSVADLPLGINDARALLPHGAGMQTF